MPEIQQVKLAGERYFKLTDNDEMRPFFMSIVSDANHWMFISSNGGLTAGRKDAEYALFPYYTDDKITESAEITGSKSIFRVHRNGEAVTWEPFSYRYEGQFKVSRNLYKSVYGNKIIFEEINHDLNLSYQYEWSSSNRYGFVRRSALKNHANSPVAVSMLDGLQNIVPFGVGSELQNRSSNLVDAYKRSELDQKSGLGIFALSAIIVDKAEPSEALKANIAWSVGLNSPTYLLSSLQLNTFRNGGAITPEADVKGEKGAYFVHKEMTLAAQSAQEWMIVANVNQDHAAVADLIHQLQTPDALVARLEQDIEEGTQKLIGLSAAADGLQLTADDGRNTRHYSNVLFNIMRGGIFDHNYDIEKGDFIAYLVNGNKQVSAANLSLVNELPETFTLGELKTLAGQSSDPDFQRLCLEYLPLKFSRRHGDPSRPWNRFSINTHSEVDGSKILDYQGNWRDIFQNWEALAHSYPDFMEGMILKFLNATTFDGYNPYRVTKGGFDWETIEEDDPWSYIGYWGDHQIIYLLKFLEFIEKHQPGALGQLFDRDFLVYANVPYKIKPYQELLKNPKDTIDFDRELDEEIRHRREKEGADGALLLNRAGEVHRVNFIEKILATVLAKISNFIPEGGIWMNTQRPEWNDANNALVGNGVSMVTLYYLRRFLSFFDGLIGDSSAGEHPVSEEVKALFDNILAGLTRYEPLLSSTINDQERKQVLDALGTAASDFRAEVYDNSFSGNKAGITSEEIRRFLKVSLAFVDHTIRANKRTDNLYHAYNLLSVEGDGVAISYLSEMLEGQVAVLSAGALSPQESLKVMDALKSSKLYRKDQYSYILYPNKDLPGFLQKNNIPAASVASSALLKKLVADGDTRIVVKDINGVFHFNGNFKNNNDLKAALKALASTAYGDLVKQDSAHVQKVFEEVFNHKEFTGRSGTFFGYEGLGSIYWHMVSKLQLAVQECYLQAIDGKADTATTSGLLKHYYEVYEGIGINKSPTLYGAFPTDPYSHTPAGKGAQQPGMTGQVKEDILSRFGELGVFVGEGQLYFAPSLLRKLEFLDEPGEFHYVDVQGTPQTMTIEKGALSFTYCQVPIVYQLSDKEETKVFFNDGRHKSFTGRKLDRQTSEMVFERSGKVQRIQVSISPEGLK
ncbi:hypothetical protein [Neolewinella persica]|uniref:hypothetical protein n=1 Tax=Neolewinella persica TaxID=70998 RepID=UPI00037B0C14|nr:hypothetical protein [Neolewinella persica]